MGCKAYLVAIHDQGRVRVRLLNWAPRSSIDSIVEDVLQGNRRLIVDFNCEECKRDLEEFGAATVIVETEIEEEIEEESTGDTEEDNER